MVKIAYILLCHKAPDAVIEQAQRLTAAGDCVAIHFDRNAPKGDFARIKGALAANANVAFAKKRVRCGWGQWSLVQATLHAVQAALEQFPRATHFYMLSGDCMPIKSAEHTHAFLEENDLDFIECFDFFKGDWIKTGMKEDRLIYRHFFNERKRKRLFYASLNVQRYLGLKRDIPHDLQMCIGSQWW
ncbi:MAG TPA: beta-1,6-N-acetylglucosaminyltransferase, partial [Paracoccaceae bacterium]|nr:beta-1,6-N-acetylglucosaminyltransferase [Paracoccaceae bacterium]